MNARVYRKVVWQWVDGKLVEIRELEQSYQYTGPVALAGAGSPNIRQIHYRVRTDVGTVDATPTWGAAEDTSYFAGYGTPFVLRVGFENTGTGAGSIGALNVLRNGSATLGTVTSTTTNPIFASDASGSADATAITVQRLTSGTGSWANGILDENGSTALTLTNGFFSEVEWGLTFNNTAGQGYGRGEVLNFQQSTGTTVVPAAITIPHIDGSDFAHDKNLGGAFSVTADQASVSMTTEAAAAADALVVVTVAVDNFGTTDGDLSEVSGVTIGGNAATKAVEFTNGQGSAQAGATVSIWYLQYSGTLASGSTITARFNNATSRDASAIAARSYTVAGGKAVAVEATATLANDGAALGSLDATTSNIECLRIRALAAESNATTLGLTTGSGCRVTDSTWSPWWGSGVAFGWGGTGTASASMCLAVEDKISTGTGSASAPKINSTADIASAYVAFKATTAGVSLTPPQGNLALSPTAPTVAQTNHVTIAPTAGQLALSGSAPGLVVNAIRSAAAGDLVLSGTAPVVAVSDHRTVAPAAGDLVLSGTAPVVARTAHVTISPAAGDLVLSSTAPSIAATDHKTLSPGAADLALTGTAPVVSVNDNRAVAPAAGDLVLTATAPVVAWTDHRTVTPASGDVVLSTTAPVVAFTEHRNISPGAADLVLSTFAPVLAASDHRTIAPASGDLVLSGSAPGVSSSASVSVVVPSGDLVLSGQAPDVLATDHRTIAPDAGALSLAATSPVVAQTAHHSATPAAADLVLSPAAPLVAATEHRAIAPDTAELLLASSAPVVAVSDFVAKTPDGAGLVLTAFAPDVLVTEHVSVAPDAGDLVLSGETPDIVVTHLDENLVIEVAAAVLTLTSTAPLVQRRRYDHSSRDAVVSPARGPNIQGATRANGASDRRSNVPAGETRSNIQTVRRG